MSRSVENPWLHRFAFLTGLATFFLVGMGGLVTSREVGMAVPDWPTTYGYNMFLVPFDRWIGVPGVFEEHSHRLMASFVGGLTTVLMVWLLLKEPRKWLRRLGVLAFFLVVFQGVLGGLRVTRNIPDLGIFHGILAQVFLVLLCCIALFTSRWWMRNPVGARSSLAGLKAPLVAGVILIFAQLALGAAMRHQHAGLAIWDFPLAHGQIWPAMDKVSVTQYNAARLKLNDQLHEEGAKRFLMTGRDHITVPQLALHMAHRLGAMAVFCSVVICALMARARLGGEHPLSKWTLAWLGVVLAQGALGVWTVLSFKAADVATLHVMLGALSLVGGSLLVASAERMAVQPICENEVTSRCRMVEHDSTPVKPV